MLSFFKNIIKSSKKEGIRINRKVITFLFCVLISSFFWLMLALSKEYNIEVSFPVTYINPPTDKVIANHLPETIDIEIKSKGFNLLSYKLKQRNETISIDMKDALSLPIRNHYFFLTNSRIDKITKQFNSDVKIIKIYPDTIFFNFSKRVSKMVPVKANLRMEFDNQYQQTDSVKLTPASIRVTGAADIIDKIKYVETEPIELKHINDSLSIELTVLKTPALQLIDLSPSKIKAKVNVTKFTESSIDVPIEIENLPKGYGLKLFPDKVTLKFDVAFKNYEKINSQLFKAVVDYSKIERGSNKLKVQLLKFPDEIKSVKMNPEKVEYIIKK